MDAKLLLSPPVLLALLFALAAAFSAWTARMAFKRKGDRPEHSGDGYACGEDFQGHLAQPDYSAFFPFAFFFTILHVVALVLASVPAMDAGVFAVAAVYGVGAVTGLAVLQRR
jgi:NADH-quinone oxidoreductase subunit A